MTKVLVAQVASVFRDKRGMPLLVMLTVLLALSALGATAIGPVTIPFSAVLSGEISSNHIAVLTNIRLPRIALTILIGAGLAISGAAMQGLFRNPLADPGLIGIASGAALAVALVVVLGASTLEALGLYGVSLAAFGGGLVTCLLIMRFAQGSGNFSVTYMLLAGIAINALAGAGTGFLTYLSDDQQIRTLSLWSMGSLGGVLWPSILVATTLIVPSCVAVWLHANQINLLLLGEQEAQHLGVNTTRLKRVIVVCTALTVGAAVAVSGIIGFVGLVVPHLIRLSIGPDHRLLIPASALCGALLLLLADTLARTIVAPAELPVGILTSIIGGPFFLWLLIKQFSRRMVL